MSFTLSRQKGPAATWDDFLSERNIKRKRGSNLYRKVPNKPKLNNWVRTLAEPTS